MDEHARRVYETIKSGMGRPAQISRLTCLGPKQVSNALRELRKQKQIEITDGDYRIVGSSNGKS